MTIIPFRLDSGAQARSILHHLLERGDIAGSDAVGRTVITFAVDDWLLERLLTFDAGSEDLEDTGDAEPPTTQRRTARLTDASRGSGHAAPD